MNDTIQIKLIPAFLPFYTHKKRYKFSYGGRGGGKSIGFADILLIKSRQENLRILCTREIQKSIKDSVYNLLCDRIDYYEMSDEFEILKNEIRHKITGSIFLFTGLREHNIESLKSFHGVDKCWVEEAQSVTQKSLTILTPTIRNEDSEIWFSYNLMSENDPVEKLRKREIRKSKKKVFKKRRKKYFWVDQTGKDAIGVKINYDGNPFFPKVLYREMEKDKKDLPKLYLHKWLGHPADKSEDVFISRESVHKAIKRKNVSETGIIRIGVDPARYGSDESVICIVKGLCVMPMIYFRGINTVQLSGNIISEIRNIREKGYAGQIIVRIDDTGVGGGVTDNLEIYSKEKDLFFDVMPVVNNGISYNNKYYNAGTEMWGDIKSSLDSISLPDDDVLEEQLTTRKYKIMPDGRLRMESKDSMRDRLLKSPDRADALGLALYNQMPSENFVMLPEVI